MIFRLSIDALIVSLGMSMMRLSAVSSPERSALEKLYKFSCESLALPLMCAFIIPLASIASESGSRAVRESKVARNLPSMDIFGSLPVTSSALRFKESPNPAASAVNFFRFALISILSSDETSNPRSIPRKMSVLYWLT